MYGERKYVWLLLALPICLLSLILYWVQHENLQDISVSNKEDELNENICWHDPGTGQTKCRPVCHHGYFGLASMTECHPWLTCEEIHNFLQIKEEIGAGAVKKVSLAVWNSHQVTLYQPLGVDHLEDFHHGLKMIKSLQPHKHIIQLIGTCERSFVTEYHRLKSTNFLEETLNIGAYKSMNTSEIRFQLCLDYVTILDYLHNSPIGTRVMCDSSDLAKTLQQYLLTDDLRLVASDLDALPLVDRQNGKLIKCGHRELGGDFVAPEQLWPFHSIPFDDSKMLPYDEKTDIWKIPDVCSHFLGSSVDAGALKILLLPIHVRCKSHDSASRPNAHEVLEEYMKILDKIKKQNYS